LCVGVHFELRVIDDEEEEGVCRDERNEEEVWSGV
jgi:hypothetical protein